MVPRAYSKTVAIFHRLIADVTLLTKRAAVSFDEAAPDFAFFGKARGVTVSGLYGLLNA